MKTYLESPVKVSADQWDGSKDKMKSLWTDVPLNHNEVDYNEDGTVKRWLTSEPGKQPVNVAPGSYIIKTVLGAISVLSEADFNKIYVAE
jgi:hypothetical protein